MKTITLLAACMCTVQLNAQALNDNLLLHYPLNNDVSDASGNGNNGTAYGGLSYGTDRNGNPNAAAYFDGIDDFIDFPNLINLKPDLPVSFSFWSNYASLNTQNCAVFNTSFEEEVNSGVYFALQTSTGKYAVGYGDGSYGYSASSRRTYVSNSVAAINEWHHIAIVVESALSMKIYVDCEETGGTYSGSGGQLQYSATPGTLGKHDQNVGIPAYFFNGYIDDFRYWDRVLTPADLDTLCNDLLSIKEESINETEFVVYPNPSSGQLHFKTSLQTIESIQLLTLDGRLVEELAYEEEIKVQLPSSGLYLLKAVDKAGNCLLTRPIHFE